MADTGAGRPRRRRGGRPHRLCQRAPISRSPARQRRRDLRTVERLFIGAPEVSEAIYRLAQAARDGARRSEEMRLSPSLARPAANSAGTGCACGRCRARAGRPTALWTVADVTHERERQENVFQELQHAIDYLDHAPAGFLSVDPDGAIVYMNATLAGLARLRSGPGRLGRPAPRRRRAAQRRRDDDRGLAAASGEVRDGDLRSRPAPAQRPDPAGAALPPRRLRPGRPARRRRAPSCSTARRATTSTRASAPPRCASRASSTTRRWRSRRSTGPGASCGRTRPSRGCSARCRAPATRAARARAIVDGLRGAATATRSRRR